MRAVALLLLAAALCFASCKEDVNNPAAWEKALNETKRTKDRVKVIEQLRESKALSPAFVPMLQGQLKAQKQGEVKAAIARLLGELKDPSSVGPLTEALDFGDPDADGKAANKEIAAALGNLGDPKAAPTLMKLLKQKDHYTRIEAINGLGALRAKEAVDPLVDIATDENGEPFISKKAIQALGDIGDAKAVPALVKMMFKERRAVSFYAESSFALSQMGKPAADALLPVLDGSDKELYDWARASNLIEQALWAKSAQVLGDLMEPRAEKALLQRLKWTTDDVFVKGIVRVPVCDALGKLRSKEAVKYLSGELGEEEPVLRQAYTKVIARTGGRDAVPALVKSAGVGVWDAREFAIATLAMVGDEKDLPAFDALEKAEEGRTAADCKEFSDGPGCTDVAGLTKRRVDLIKGHRARLDAAKECKADPACWAGKLDDGSAGVRERAAYEVGRSGKPELVEKLMAKLTEKNLDARMAIMQGASWLIHDSPDALAKAKAGLPALEKQLADEKGKTEFVKVNEDVRRLAVTLRR
jgi:HEAT repeat protein